MSDPNAPQEGVAAAPSSWQPAPTAPPVPQGGPGEPPAPGGPASPGAQFGGPDSGPVAPPKKRGKLGRVISGVVVVLVLAIIGVGYSIYSNRDTAAKAKEGDCLSGAEITSDAASSAALKVTTCDSADARYKVVGLVADKTQAEVKDELCQPFVDKGAEVIYWQEKSRGAGSGNVLCLAPAK